MDGLVHLTNPLQLLMLMSSDHYNPPGLVVVMGLLPTGTSARG